MNHSLFRVSSVLVPVVILAAAAPRAQQSGGAATSASPPAITGRVLAAESGAPLRRARIEVLSARRAVATVLTDDAGAFVVEASGTAPFDLTVSKAGRIFGVTTLSREQSAAPLVVRLSRAAVITGRVIDQHGSPVGANVSATRVESADTASGLPQVYSTFTDDLGEYRIVGLTQGRYRVTAALSTLPIVISGPSGSTVTYSTAPAQGSNETRIGRTLADARTPTATAGQTIDVAPGDEVAAGDISVTVPDAAAQRRDLALVLGRPLAAEAAPLKPGFAAGIRGRLTTESGEPVRSASVRVSGVATFSVTTDDDGRYFVRGLRPGTYTVEVMRPGHAPLGYGQSYAQQESRAILVSEAAVIEGVDLVLPRGASISGSVFDEHGEPMQDVRVQALELRHSGGRIATSPVGPTRRTDDRGRYRISGLLPGTYVVRATVDAALSRGGPGPGGSYLPMYYPGTPLAEASAAIELNADATGVGFVVAPIRAAAVQGTARDGDGFLVAGTARLFPSRRTAGIVVEPRTAAIGPGGTFEFAAVPPGNYVVQVLGDGPGRTGLFGTATVSVGDADPPPLTVPTSHGATLEGRLIIEGSPGDPTCLTSVPPGLTVSAPCPDGRAPTYSVVPLALDPDLARDAPAGVFVSSGGTFYISSLFGPTGFLLRGGTASGWYLKSLKVGGLEIADSGFDFGAGPRTFEDAELVISRNGGTIAGRVESAADPVADYSVVVFPVDRQQWTLHSRFVKFTRAAIDGSFRVPGLPAGDYLVAAVDRLSGTAEGGDWQDGAVLARLAPLAQRTSVADGQTRTVTARLIRR